MNLSNLSNATLLALALALAATGCKHRTPAVTPLNRPGGVTGGEIGPGSAGTLGSTSGLDSSIGSTGLGATGLASNPANAHQGWPENAEIFKSETVYFPYDSSAVSASEHSKVAAVADYLKANPGDAVRVEGNCDERGTEEYNRALGERRALAVREMLVGMGIDPSRVDTISYGKDRPAVYGHDESAWRKNRRDDFILLTPP